MDYSKVTAIEYFEKKRKIMDSLGRTGGNCGGVICRKCPLYLLNGDERECAELEINTLENAIKAIMEYEIPVDWSKVPVDTKILVRNRTGRKWYKRHFAKYEDGKVYAFFNGYSSFTASDENEVNSWNYAKLYEGEE